MSACNSTCFEYFSNENVPFYKLCRMAAALSYHNYEWRFDTLVIFNSLYLTSLEAFFKIYHQAIVVKKGKHIPPQYDLPGVYRPHVPQFIIFGESAAELQDYFEWLMKMKYDNTARYIIVCATDYFEQCNEHILFETLAKNAISNTVYLKMSTNYEPETFTSFPLRPHQPCFKNDPEKINITYGCPNDECYKNVFPNKFDNFYHCPLKISTFEQPPYMYLKNGTSSLEVSGSDGEILKLVSNLMNATLMIMTPIDGLAWGNYDNGNWTGSLGDVFNRRAYGSMCSSPLTNGKFGNFQISFTYDSMDLVWVASMPAAQPSWKKLLYPFPISLRIILFFMFLGIVLLNSFTRTKFWNRIMKEMNIKPWRSNWLVYSWILFLGMPVSRLPHRLSFRILVYSWIWYCCIIRCVYQAALIGSLKTRVYEHSIQNFSEVLMNKNPFGGILSLRDYYSTDRRVYDNWVVINQDQIHKILDEISTGESNFVIAVNKEMAIEHVMKYNGTRQIQIIPEKIVNSPTVIYFKKYSHLALPISKILTVLLEGGFTQRLYAEYVMYVKLLQQDTNHAAESLKMIHFTGSFVLLIIGCALSCLFFAIEVVCGRKK